MLEAWVERSGLGPNDRVVVCQASMLAEARGRFGADLAYVACYPLSAGDELMAVDAEAWFGVRADAYASTELGLREALSFVRQEDRGARGRGPLRLVWLGALGQLEPRDVGPVGRAYALTATAIVGRSPSSDIVLRTGGHSDQNTVARRHAAVTVEGEVVRIRDFSSTNGTWVDGRRVAEGVLLPGSELAFAGTLRFRLDGAGAPE
ncbi:MAG: FHA domain-containing protein [Polyangiaceae bacterium]|nr:FHA domain-containing protein [Polyangiaceae bacterium]